MDEALKRVQMAGYPQMASSQGVIDQTKADYLGSKAPFVFTCFRCQKTYKTGSEFKLTDNYLEQQAKWKASGFIQNFLYKILGSIPVIGYRLSQTAAQAASDKIYGGGADRMEKAKEEAFAEVQDNFVKCSKCGEYGCKDCSKGGVCKICQAL